MNFKENINFFFQILEIFILKITLPGALEGEEQ